MKRKGRFTLPGESNFLDEIKEIMEKWGADAIRDSDGTKLDDEIKKLTSKINDKDVKNEVMWMSGVLFLNTPDEAISKLKNIQTNNPNDKQKIEEIKNIYQMKLDFDNGVKSLEKIQTVWWIHMINEQLQRIQTERANLFNKYRTNLAVWLKEQYNKIYNEKDKLLLNLVPSNSTVDEPNLWKEWYPTINAHDRKELLNDKEELDINFPKIWELPTDWWNLDSFYLYFTDETAISLKNILEISEKYAKRELKIDWLTEKEGNYEFDWKEWEKISNEDKLTVEILLKYTEIKNKIEIFKNTVENLKNRDVEEINKFKETLKNDSENNLNFFREKISNYENKIKEICWKIYKNKLPDNFSEIWDWVNWSNTVSRYKELENRMKIIYGDNYTFWAEGVSTALLGLKIYFDKVTWDVKQEVVIGLNNDKLNLNLEQAWLLDSYKVFYDSLPERFKKYFTDYKNKEEMNKTRISWIIDSIRIVNKEIKKEENKNMNGDHNSFKNQYKSFTKKLEDFWEKEIKI